MDTVSETKTAGWTYITRQVDFDLLLSAFRQVVQDWQDTGDDILEVHSTPGLVLADLVHHLGLSPADTRLALGDDLAARLQALGLL